RRHGRRKHLGLDHRCEIVHRREIGVVVDRDEPQGRIALITRERRRNVVGLLGTGLRLEAGPRTAVGLTRQSPNSNLHDRCSSLFALAARNSDRCKSPSDPSNSFIVPSMSRMPRAINIARGPEREPDNSVTRNVCSARGIEKCRSAIESMLHDAELGCRSPTTRQVAEIFLDYPPKLTCLCDGALPGSRSEILSADRRILC